MEWEVRIIEWLQAHLSGMGGLVKLLAFLGAETGLLMLVLICRLLILYVMREMLYLALC